MRCSFCIIPSTRGQQRSRKSVEIVAEVQAMVEGGYQEVVVTGVQISAYRGECGGLFELIRALLEDTDVARLRLTSIAPWQLDERLLELMNGPRICRHLHFSLQSGCEATLNRMRRPYTPEDYRRLVDVSRQRVDGLAVTTDVIVGFPGESALEFAQSLDFVEEMAFAKTHVFGYSQRAGTQAADLPDQTAPGDRRERVQQMLQVAGVGERSFRESHVGQSASVLWEDRRAASWRGMTDNYIRVETESLMDLQGQLTPARLTEVSSRGMVAVLEPSSP